MIVVRILDDAHSPSFETTRRTATRCGCAATTDNFRSKLVDLESLIIEVSDTLTE